MFYLCYLLLFTYTGVQHDFHIRFCSYRLTVTRQVSYVKQELSFLPEFIPGFSATLGALSLVFRVMFDRTLFVF